MARGRKRKVGVDRNKSGRIRYPVQAHDKGSERSQAMQARYGVHYASAIGRAYASKLLGEGNEADDRYQAGKRFARMYSAILAPRHYRCPLDRSPGGKVVPIDHERDRADQEWLYTAIDRLNASGLRPWLDELVSVEYVDRDPPWLTRLLLGGSDPYDVAMMAHCCRALDLIAPPRKDMGIRAVRSA